MEQIQWVNVAYKWKISSVQSQANKNEQILEKREEEKEQEEEAGGRDNGKNWLYVVKKSHFIAYHQYNCKF